MSIARKLLLATAFLSALIPVPAAHADYLLELFDRDDIKTRDHCDTDWVLGYIKQRYDGKVRAYLGNKLFMLDIRNVKYRYSKMRDEEHLVGRQYCQATVIMNDRKPRTMFYSLEYPWGFAGNLTHVEFCIQGLDPDHIYGKACSTVR